MSKEQLIQRMLAVWGKVDLSKLRRPSLLTDEDWQRLYEAADVVARAPIYIDDTPALSTLELRARARRLKAEKGLGLIVVDYLQLMRTSRRTDSRELEISDISPLPQGLGQGTQRPRGGPGPAQPQGGRTRRQTPHALGPARVRRY